MIAPNIPTRVLAIVDHGPIEQQIIDALRAQTEFTLSPVANSVERLSREVHAAEPDIILIDDEVGGQNTLDQIDDLALQVPDAAVIAILPSDNPVLAQQVTLAGARAFLIEPFTQINLLSTLRRVRDLEMRRTKTVSQKAQDMVSSSAAVHTISVFSPRGGVGTSTIAINLAIALLEESGARVLLVEGKLIFGHLGVMLNLRSQNTIADLIPHISSLDEDLLKDVVVQHASGLSVLLAPRDLQVSQGIKPDDIFNILVNLRKYYDYIVIDAGSILNENTVTMLDASDKILLVSSPELAALHDTSRFIQIGQSLAYPADKTLLVLNRSGMRAGIRNNDIEAALHLHLFTQIPEDIDSALRSLNRGIPMYIRYPRSPASRAFKLLAANLISFNHPISAEEANRQAAAKQQREALLASSKFG